MTDIEKSIAKLQRCFPGSYITDRNELIIHPRTNQYIILENIGTEDAIKAKVLEWLSRAAFKTAPYSQEWRNRKFHKYMRDGINAFLDTDFSEDDMELIYTCMGLACDHWLTLMFIDHDMSIEWLKEYVSCTCPSTATRAPRKILPASCVRALARHSLPLARLTQIMRQTACGKSKGRAVLSVPA